MKRIFTTLVLISLLTVIVFPLLVSAQPPATATGELERPAECCKLRRELELEEGLCSSDSIVGPTGGYCPTRIGTINYTKSSWGMYCLLNTIYNVTDWIFIILMLIVVVLIITGAFMFATAGGNPEKTTTARNFILYAIIGLVVGLIAKAIPTIVRLIMGM